MKSKFGEALILLKKGQLEQAKNIFSEILNDEPNNFNVYNNIGNISFLLGNLDDALQNYDKAIKLKTTYIRYVYPVLVIWPLLQLELTNKK